MHPGHPQPLAPKIAALHDLHLAGLPVPEFVALADPHDQDPDRWSAITKLLERGPVIVRTALFDEDREHTAAAGLGASIPDCGDLAAVRLGGRTRQRTVPPAPPRPRECRPRG